MSNPSPSGQAKAESKPSTSNYVWSGGALAAYGAGLAALVRLAPVGPTAQRALLGPIYAMVLLTAIVWLTMVIVRNYAILRGKTSSAYYTDYRGSAPADWIERPARTFNNLMQVPSLFYLVCLLMLWTRMLDPAQLWLAWVFVGTRALHALVYVVWNHVPARFTAYVASTIALAVLWVRFASQVTPGP